MNKEKNHSFSNCLEIESGSVEKNQIFWRCGARAKGIMVIRLYWCCLPKSSVVFYAEMNGETREDFKQSSYLCIFPLKENQNSMCLKIH